MQPEANTSRSWQGDYQGTSFKVTGPTIDNWETCLNQDTVYKIGTKMTSSARVETGRNLAHGGERERIYVDLIAGVSCFGKVVR